MNCSAIARRWLARGQEGNAIDSNRRFSLPGSAMSTTLDRDGVEAPIHPSDRPVHLPRYLAALDSPINLAVFRAVLFAYLAWFTATEYDFVWFASLPAVLRMPPPLTNWLIALPISPATVAAGRLALIVTALVACVGWHTRITTVAATVLAVIVLGVPEMYGGKVDHYHHLVWFAGIIASSRCADAFSVDSWLRGGQTPPGSSAYALPLRIIWLLIGCIYLFPGLAKAAIFIDWIYPDNLRYQLYQKWAELDHFTPLFRIDRWPAALTIAAASTIAFEVSFIWLVLFERTRWVAVVAGLLFHQMTAQMMGIDFFALQICYVSFIPWDRVVAWLRPHAKVEATPSSAAPHAATWPTVIVGGSILAAAVAAGVTGLDSWPFAVYPRFNYIAAHTMTQLELVPVDRAGVSRPISFTTERRVKTRMKEARWTRLLSRATMIGGRQRQQQFALALLDVLGREDPQVRAAASVEIYQTTRSLPMDRCAPPLSRVLLARVTLSTDHQLEIQQYRP
jgi:hypothetical protein